MMTNCGLDDRNTTMKTITNDSNDTPEHVCSSRTVKTAHNTSNDMLNKVLEMGVNHITEKRSSLVNDTSTAMDKDHPIDEKISCLDNTDDRSTVKWRVDTSREMYTRWLVNG